MTENNMSATNENVNPPGFASHAVSFHQHAAMYAARMIRLQYANESKSKFRRECFEHLKASLRNEGGSE